MIQTGVILTLVVMIALVTSAGCTGATEKEKKQDVASWNLSRTGEISFQLPPARVTTGIIEENSNLTVENLTFSSFAGDVHAVLVVPPHPSRMFVWALGANNAASGYIEHMKYYPPEGVGVLILDIRGNGGVTPGYPMNIERDFSMYANGEWPQFYLITADLIQAGEYLHERYPGIPVWAVGESNGGRYAALAAEADPGFSGYIGISTSGFDRIGNRYESPAREFLLSIDPTVSVRAISPRPVILFHAPDDPVIPYRDGQNLSLAAGPDAIFIPFNGTHGVNREVDAEIIRILQETNAKTGQGEP
ncbi:MAG: alpha/beta hydrolase [Methanospirillum sp.]|nr:alpha/beta hydrolase [Methanospirillum sp.]